MPRSFRHQTCGTITELPATVLATILRDPHLVGNTVRCERCARPVPLAECSWTDTGRDLQSYLDELRDETTEEWTDSFDWPDETEEGPHQGGD